MGTPKLRGVCMVEGYPEARATDQTYIYLHPTYRLLFRVSSPCSIPAQQDHLSLTSATVSPGNLKL
jgi:hypothetical protein